MSQLTKCSPHRLSHAITRTLSTYYLTSLLYSVYTTTLLYYLVF